MCTASSSVGSAATTTERAQPLASRKAGGLHYGGGMRLRRTSLLPCSTARLRPELAKPMLLNWVSWPMLHFLAVDPPALPERFADGRYRTRLLLGMILPIGEHTLDLRITPGPDPGLVLQDASSSKVIQVWDHRIHLEDYYGMTRYTDEVEVHAGPLTIPVWLFAYAYYAHRQRRLNLLVGSGFAY
jgi:hypothetical protein